MQVEELEQLIIDLCLGLQTNLNIQKLRENMIPTNEVRYQYTRTPEDIHILYDGRIYVNRTLIFRETYYRERIPTDKEYEQIQDEQCKFNVVRMLIQSIFNYGIMSSRQIIKDRVIKKDISIIEDYLKQLKKIDNDGGKTKGTDNY